MPRPRLESCSRWCNCPEGASGSATRTTLNSLSSARTIKGERPPLGGVRHDRGIALFHRGYQGRGIVGYIQRRSDDYTGLCTAGNYDGFFYRLVVLWGDPWKVFSKRFLESGKFFVEHTFVTLFLFAGKIFLPASAEIIARARNCPSSLVARSAASLNKGEGGHWAFSIHVSPVEIVPQKRASFMPILTKNHQSVLLLFYLIHQHILPDRWLFNSLIGNYIIILTK